MEPILLQFGDIFIIGDDDYVYLGSSLETVYAARILSIGDTRQLESIIQRYTQRGESVDENPMLCHVILTTEQFNNRAVFLGRTTPSRENHSRVCLNDDDLSRLRHEILEGPLSSELKRIIRSSTD